MPEPAMARALIDRRVRESIAVKRELLDPARAAAIAEVAGVVAEALRRGGKLLVFGNGGSAADAQHVAAELVGRYLLDRRSLPAVALCDNQAALTALSNDYGYEEVFARQVEALGSPGDVALGISTSGASENVAAGLRRAGSRGLVTVALTGECGGPVAEAARHSICVPSADTPRVQEAHTLVAHLLCEIVERELCGEH